MAVQQPVCVCKGVLHKQMDVSMVLAGRTSLAGLHAMVVSRAAHPSVSMIRWYHDMRVVISHGYLQGLYCWFRWCSSCPGRLAGSGQSQRRASRNLSWSQGAALRGCLQRWHLMMP